MLLALLLTIFSYGIFVTNKKFLIDTTAIRLRAQAKPVIESWMSVSNSIFPFDKVKLDQFALDLSSRDTKALILDNRGNILSWGKHLITESLSVLPDKFYYSISLSGENEVTYIAKEKSGIFLVVLIPLRGAPARHKILGLVQLSTPLSGVYEILDRQKLMLKLGIIILLISGAAAGYWITWVSLKDLTSMVKVCNTIAEGDLDLRIDLPKRKDEIGQVANAFDNMISRIEELFTVQNRFIANAAHELRTPMTSLQGSLEVLMRGAQDDPQSFLRLTQGMYREVTRLNRMCEQLLDLSRIDKPMNIRKKSLRINSYLKDFLQYAELMAEGREIVLKKGPNLYLLMDPDSLRQILFNLTDNAVQHTGENGIITFTWELSGSDIIITVSDNGYGISPEDLPSIFEPFYRGDRSRSRITGGTGLGLAIVKNLVEANGGEIKAESTVDEGTVILLSFPVIKS